MGKVDEIREDQRILPQLQLGHGCTLLSAWSNIKISFPRWGVIWLEFEASPMLGYKVVAKNYKQVLIVQEIF